MVMGAPVGPERPGNVPSRLVGNLNGPCRLRLRH